MESAATPPESDSSHFGDAENSPPNDSPITGSSRFVAIMFLAMASLIVLVVIAEFALKMLR